MLLATITMNTRMGMIFAIVTTVLMKAAPLIPRRIMKWNSHSPTDERSTAVTVLPSPNIGKNDPSVDLMSTHTRRRQCSLRANSRRPTESRHSGRTRPLRKRRCRHRAPVSGPRERETPLPACTFPRPRCPMRGAPRGARGAGEGPRERENTGPDHGADHHGRERDQRKLLNGLGLHGASAAASPLGSGLAGRPLHTRLAWNVVLRTPGTVGM